MIFSSASRSKWLVQKNALLLSRMLNVQISISPWYGF
jgi:hypothetical protein